MDDRHTNNLENCGPRSQTPRRSLCEIFLEAVEIEEDSARKDFLSGACGGDQALRWRVEELLAADEAGGGQDGQAEDSGMQKSERVGSRIGHYKLLQQIGEGGCGAVFMAEQEEPVRRRVALKVIKLGMDTRQVVARFEAERQALALMDHPNIAQVLDAGSTDSGRPYFVMELVRGIKITDYCDQNHLDTDQRIQLFIQVCHGVQHAHQKGIIHRDLKPSNILVTELEGVPLPKIIDFGIAKAVEGRLTDQTLFTAFEQFLGTPAYMSPEQAALTATDIDTRSDIYSLGVLLYELLTGKTPFDTKALLASGLDEMRRTIREVEPVRPSTRIRQASAMSRAKPSSVARPSPLASDLDWIVMKCLEKDRRRRYETANGLALDLQRHLDNHPVLARPPSRLYEFQKSVRRHKVGFGATAAVLVALAAGLGFSTWMFFGERSARERAVAAEMEQSRLHAEEQKAHEQAETQVYFSHVNLAQEALRDSNFLRARRMLEQDIPSPGHPDYRNWEWRYLWDAVKSDELATLGNQTTRITGVGFSSDGSVAGACDIAGVFKLWDVITCSNIATFHYDGELYGLAFQPGGDLVAAAGSHSVALWSWQTRTAMGGLPHPRGVRGVCFFPDGRRLAVLCDDSRLLIWDSQTRKFTGTFPTTIDRQALLNGGLAISPDGKTVAAAGVSGPFSLFSASGAGPVRIIHHQANITSLAFAPKTNQLLVAGWDTGLWVYELDHLRLLTNFFAHKSWVSKVAFSPSGDVAVSSGADQLIRFWSTHDWRPIGVLKGNHEELGPVAFSPDDKYLVSGAKDGEVKLWDAETKSLDRNDVQIPPDVTLLTESPNERYIATRTRGNHVQIRTATSMALLDEFTPSADPRYMGVSPGGQLCAAVDVNGSNVLIYAGSIGRVVTNLVGNWKDLRLAEFSRDGASLLVVEGTTNCEVWSTATWSRRLKAAIPVPGYARLRLSAHARWLAVIADGWAKVWRLSSPPVCFPITGHMEEVWDVAFSPDGTCMASVGEGGSACIQRLGEKKHFRRFRTGLLSAVALAFSPDGSRLVTVNSDGSLRVWETGAYDQVLSIIIPSAFRVARHVWFVDDNTVLEQGILEYNASKPFFRRYYAPPLLAERTPNNGRQ